VPAFRVKIGGGLGPSDKPLVEELRQKLVDAGLGERVEFHPNLDRTEKIRFYESLSLFSVPAMYGESFGLYLLEALAAGVPVVQPRHAAFPEIVEGTGGGLICDPNPEALAVGMEALLADPARARELGERGRRAIHERFTIEKMADEMLQAFAEAVGRSGSARALPRSGTLTT
jgi:glycosyltransferase involved in cell wall biosynthesis